MALLAGATKALVVLVVFRVAGNTGLALLYALFCWRIVTRATLKAYVGAIKLKVGLLVVIK